MVNFPHAQQEKGERECDCLVPNGKARNSHCSHSIGRDVDFEAGIYLSKLSSLFFEETLFNMSRPPKVQVPVPSVNKMISPPKAGMECSDFKIKAISLGVRED
jgi:hypothetical protein